MSQPPTNTVATACRFHQALDALEAAEESKLLNLPVPGRRENCNKGGHFVWWNAIESKAITIWVCLKIVYP